MYEVNNEEGVHAFLMFRVRKSRSSCQLVNCMYCKSCHARYKGEEMQPFPLFCPFLFPYPDSICLGEGAATFKFEHADAIRKS